MPAYSANVDRGFESAILRTADAVGASDPRELLVILFAESSVTAKADLHIKDAQGNVTSRFIGINQFYVDTTGNPDTWSGVSRGLSPDAYLALPASAQLAGYVTPFWLGIRNQKGPSATSTAVDLYWCNFLPGTYVPGASLSHVITQSPGIVKNNPRLAHGKSYITKGDLAAFLVERQHEEPDRWGELLDRVESAMGVRSDPVGVLWNPTLPGGGLGAPAKAGIGLGLLAAGAGIAYAVTRKS